MQLRTYPQSQYLRRDKRTSWCLIGRQYQSAWCMFHPSHPLLHHREDQDTFYYIPAPNTRMKIHHEYNHYVFPLRLYRMGVVEQRGSASSQEQRNLVEMLKRVVCIHYKYLPFVWEMILPRLWLYRKGTIVKMHSITSEKKLPSKKLFITKQGLISGMSSSSFGKK